MTTYNSVFELKSKLCVINYNKTSSKDETPERDVTYRIIYFLSVYLFTTEL